MKTHRKPDLLFILIVFVGIGFIISSYIQYTHTNANASKQTPLAAQESVLEPPKLSNDYILVSTEAEPIADTPSPDSMDVVNKSAQ